jgi:hypothetical protein
VIKSYSQAGQDLAVMAILHGNMRGRFVDFGSSHPTELSNTYALEQLGWRGILLDSNINAIEMCREQRVSPAICDNAVTCDWRSLISKHIECPEQSIDYASVDVDEHTHAALCNLLRSGSRFRVLTVEHDFYARGERLRQPNRQILREYGYELIAADVRHNDCTFEDWFVAPDLVDMTAANGFRSEGLDWADVLKQGGAL